MRVLTVDDSPLFQDVLSAIISAAPGLSLAGRAFDGREAVEKVIELCPDVVTLDVEMPVLDGLASLERIMRVRPTPVIMVSSHTRSASAATIRALQLGAVDFVEKPQGPAAQSIRQLKDELVEKLAALGERSSSGKPSVRAPRDRRVLHGRKPRVVVVGASTGGTGVLTRIFNALPARVTTSVIAVQHMPAGFTAEFARRLSETVLCPVREARHGELLDPGVVFIVPGGFHCTVYGNTFRLSKGEPVHGYMPSIDVTMESVARRFGPDVCGVLLTGIGRDGAEGIRAIRESGGCTIAQDESTSVAFGMPKAAIATGKVDVVLTESEILEEIRLMAARER